MDTCCPDTAECLEKVRAVCGAIPVHAVRARDGCGMDALRAYLTPGTTICLFGSSGVGKSTLVNALVGQEVMRTGEIRILDGKGRHTTTHRQLIDVDGRISHRHARNARIWRMRRGGRDPRDLCRHHGSCRPLPIPRLYTHQ